MDAAEKNVINHPVFELQKIIYLPLPIALFLMRIFVMVLDTNGSLFAFVAVVGNFLRKHKAEICFKLINDMINSFQSLWCNAMNIMVKYLHSHIDRFPELLGDTSHEQGE